MKDEPKIVELPNEVKVESVMCQNVYFDTQGAYVIDPPLPARKRYIDFPKAAYPKNIYVNEEKK